MVSGGGSANGVNLMLTDSIPLADGRGWTASFETDEGDDANVTATAVDNDNVAMSFTVTAWVICGPVDTSAA